MYRHRTIEVHIDYGDKFIELFFENIDWEDFESNVNVLDLMLSWWLKDSRKYKFEKDLILTDDDMRP